jgi:hypothetical protein
VDRLAGVQHSDCRDRDGTITESERQSQGLGPEDIRVKRAKYLDWCSAQVADHFLALSPDEIFELAERATQEDPESSGRSLSSSEPADELSSYRAVVERVTEVLARELQLPDFDSWLELYARDPRSVEARLLGFWKEGL